MVTERETKSQGKIKESYENETSINSDVDEQKVI